MQQPPKKVFIDGQAGTVGLSIRERLAQVRWITVMEVPSDLRKDLDARLAILCQVDLAVLCLPDAVAVETVGLIRGLSGRQPKILDASTSHRVAPGWTYGFPELEPEQASRIRAARFVSNPGCYATGSIALLRPLVDEGAISPDDPITINAVSGYSGGGHSLIEDMENGTSPAFKLYGLDLIHKHLPEIQQYTGLRRKPIFVPSVGDYKQGMLVSIPLHLSTLSARPRCGDIQEILDRRYASSNRVSVLPATQEEFRTELDPVGLNNTDGMEIRVFPNQEGNQIVLVARLDNLGMGAGGTAVRNIELMLTGDERKSEQDAGVNGCSTGAPHS